ncbi:biopolymer transport protein ExbD [Allopseudospirillum japonicum]|uniref:Biopolymer transport protein ExbD n=1 Tax=Allopseudospirillum japonicum TaxID=64971 RepID=A0A1H6RZ07_9GAMM|nr:biopolymer transporter ExbD [Allopseudospirillum japonicum]SEI61013.1 biopolymer transport protein ExbD [Allopseudospirillum japonicum]
MQYYPRKRLSNQSINITPLIDIVFILLVFFMLTSHFINEKQFEVSLPDAKSGHEKSLDNAVFININLMGHLYKADQLLSDEQLDALLLQMVEQQQSLLLRVDKRSPFEPVMALMDRARQEGVSSIGFAVEEPVR